MNPFSILRADERWRILLRQLYHQHGYSPYRMSKFEEYDLYVRNKNFLVSENILTFTDTDGRLMALKPDVTLSIVKNTADSGQGLQKIYYTENVYRTSPAAAGYREIMQAGLECIGDLDLFSTCEVISLAEQSLRLISSDYLLDLSHMGFLSGLLQDLEEDIKSQLLTEIAKKNVPAIRSICDEGGLSPELAGRIGALAALYGPPEQVLPKLRLLAEQEEELAACRELEEVCRVLAATGQSDRLRLDFSIIGGMSYYNGIIFRGYLPGLASAVLAGGRYDNLLRRMKKSGGAIGFAVYLDQLERLEEPENSYDVDVLLLYDEESDPAEVAGKAAEYGETGLVVRAGSAIPPGLRCRRTVDLRKGGAK